MKRIVDTRDQIMDRAAQLLMSRGFNGFSYRDISSHLGVKNAAVHYHFPAKTDLAMALLGEYRQLLRDNTSEFMAYGGPARPQIEGFFTFTYRQCDAGRCICPFGAFSIDYGELPEDVRKATIVFGRHHQMVVAGPGSRFPFKAELLLLSTHLQDLRQPFDGVVHEHDGRLTHIFW